MGSLDTEAGQLARVTCAVEHLNGGKGRGGCSAGRDPGPRTPVCLFLAGGRPDDTAAELLE